MSTVDVRARVQALLTKHESIAVGTDGVFSIRNESTRVFVRVYDWRDGQSTLVSIFAPVLVDASPSAALDSYVARHADDYVFGHLSIFDNDAGTVDVFLSHMLLGDHLDEPELMNAVYGVASSANALDDELASTFGGRVFHGV